MDKQLTEEIKVAEPKNHSVLVACLVAQQEPWLQRFLDCLTKLDYPQDAIRHAFVEGKNVPLLHQWTKANTWIKEVNPPIADRFERLAYLRNLLVDEAHPIGGEDYILWIDSDVVDFPPSLIKDLMKHNVQVVAPSVWIEGTQQFYDTLAFRNIYGQRIPAWDIPYKGFMEMGSVGCVYMVAARLYSQSKIRYHGGDSEQVKFCEAVRQKGEKVYADFDIHVQHANLPWYGKTWH